MNNFKPIIGMCLLSGSAPLFAESGPEYEESPPASVQSTASTASSSSSTACYFNDNGSITWKWGLTSTNAWYYFSGDWVTTDHTKIEKFSTTVSYDEIYQSCMSSQAYYSVPGNLFAIFAATSGIGKNYPILLGGGELFPQY